MEIYISSSKTSGKLLLEIIWKGNSLPPELAALGEEVRNMVKVCEHSYGLHLSRSQKKVTVSKNDCSICKCSNKSNFRVYS